MEIKVIIKDGDSYRIRYTHFPYSSGEIEVEGIPGIPGEWRYILEDGATGFPVPESVSITLTRMCKLHEMGKKAMRTSRLLCRDGEG